MSLRPEQFNIVNDVSTPAIELISCMKIIDNENLIPDKAIIELIIRKHPLSENLCRIINNLIIELSAGPEIYSRLFI